MKYLPADASLFQQNRKKLVDRLPWGAVAILHSNDILPSNADGTLPFRQNANLYYLTGIEQEETILLLAPYHPNERLREVLFVRKTNESIAIWEGHKYTKAEAKAQSGIENIQWTDQFDNTLRNVLVESDIIYLDTNEHLRSSTSTETRNDRFITSCKKQFPLHEYKRLAPLIYDLRSVKSEQEIAQIRKACDITAKGFRRALSFVEPGVWEFEVEAEILHEFQMNRSRRFAYEPIIAGGRNSCVLHYLDNDKPLKDGDVLLMDIGAEYANYHADMTRVIPVNGKFTPRQKEIYAAVLRVKNAATDLLVPGITIPEYHQQVGSLMEKELLDLKLLTRHDIDYQDPEWPAYKKYFMHGTSHHLGLDVHDVASLYKPLEANMVFTVEPGIYLPEEGIGIRLEDDVVVTESRPINLMADIPIEIEEIEDLMQNQS
jgi:Xaa-Pro aminopeptidase